MRQQQQQQQPTPHHRRRISEPPDLSQSRRMLAAKVERSQSTRDLAATTTPPPPTEQQQQQQQQQQQHRPTRSSCMIDVSHFQDSWTNASSFLHDHNNNISSSSSTTDFASSAWGANGSAAAAAFASNQSLVSSTTTTSTSSSSNNNAAEPRPLVSTASSSLSADAAVAVTATTTTIAASAIHDAARITDWDAVLELCHSHPELASYQGSVGYTALHHACNRRCPRVDVVKALLEATTTTKSLYQQEDEKGWLPLHFACRFKMPAAAVQLLLEYDTGKWTVSKRDRLGRTPLFYGIRYDAPAGVVELLLQQDPSVILAVDENDDSPLKLVWDAWADKLQGKRIVHSFLPGGFECKKEALSVHERARLLRERLPTEHKLYHKWQKANLLLQAAFGFPVAENAVTNEEEDEEGYDVNDDLKSSSLLETTATATATSNNDSNNENKRTWRIVHATAAVKCHLSLFLLACALHPEQVAELDENDLRRDGSTTSSTSTTNASTTRPPHQTALHLAASSNADGEAGKAVILTLLSLHREAAEVQDGIDGSLPLHRMVENERKRDWPQHAAILYHFYPRAVQVADFNGRLPLHRAAAAMTPQATAQQHHTTNDDGGEEEQDDDMTEERSVIIQLVRAFPQAASRADSAGYFPLHLAAQNAAGWDENLQALYNAHRAAVLAGAGPDGRLALHMAAANPKAEPSLIERLLELHPRAASMPDRDGNLPLHLACAQGRDWQVVRLLYETFPAAVHQARDGWLPLHMACASESDGDNSSDNDLIAQLVNVYPAAASVPDRNGQYPLHLACGSGKSWKIGGLEALVQADAEVTATPDAAGLMPFHVAALKYCPPEEDSESTTTLLPPWLKSQEEDCTKEAAELDIMFELLRADPTGL